MTLFPDFNVFVLIYKKEKGNNHEKSFCSATLWKQIMAKELYFISYTWDLRGPTCMLTEMLPKHIQAPIEKKTLHALFFYALNVASKKHQKN